MYDLLISNNFSFFSKLFLDNWIFAKQFLLKIMKKRLWKDYEKIMKKNSRAWQDIETVIERRVWDINPSYYIIKVLSNLMGIPQTTLR